MDLISVISLVAQMVTYASFLSGAKVCYSIYKQKSCAKLSPMPFLAGLNCTALWFRYGYLANEREIMFVNLIGLSCSIIYLTFFVIYSKQKSRLLKQLLSLVALLMTLFYSIHKSEQPLFLSGSLASLSTLLACASPMATIQDVIQTKCTASLPFPIIASSFIVSLSWLIFGYLKHDSYVVFSNIVAVAISGAQLTLFIIYPDIQPSEKQLQEKLITPSMDSNSDSDANSSSNGISDNNSNVNKK